MNLRTITAKLKAFVAAAKALARGLFFKSQRGVEWHRLTHDRYPWVVAFISLAMVLVMLRIVFFILSPDGKRYAEMASKVNPPRYSAVEPMRGSIYARDGRPVAVTSPVYRLFFDFGHEALEPLRQPLPPKDGDSKQQAKREQILKLRAEYEAGLDSLAELMANTFDLSARKLTKAKLKARWKQGFDTKSRHCAVYPADVPYVQYRAFEQAEPFVIYKTGPNRYKKRLFSKLIYTENESRRVYPFGSLAYRTIGHIYDRTDGGLTKARFGLELRYNDLLRGELGEKLSFYNMGRYEQTISKPPVDGASVYTTLDMNIQSIVESNLREQLSYLEAESGTVVLMEVKTGKVVSISNLQRTAPGVYHETVNMAVSDMSEPGSTFKVASMMVALDDGVVHPNDTIDVGNGLWKYGGKVIRDHNAHHGGYGRLSVAQTIIKSSNVGVAKIITRAYESRPDDYVQKIRNLGFGEDLKLEIDGYEKARIRKRSDNPDRWYNTTLGWMSYGYETQVPPIYTLAFFNAIANGGRYMRPYFVSEIRRQDQVIKTFEPTVVREQICKPETLTAIQEMLRRVVTEGTGKKARSPFVAISGKSGTAQLASGRGGYRDSTGHVRHQVSFCAYFPSEAPKYSCIAVIRRPSSQFSAGGGVMAAPIIRKIAESLLALEDPIPLDSLHRSSSPKAYTKEIAAGRASALLAVMAQLGMPTPRMPKDAGLFIAVDTTLHARSLPATNGRVPAVVGMSAMDAVYLLRKMGYNPRLRGAGNVVGQSIPAGSPAAAGTEVVLELGFAS